MNLRPEQLPLDISGGERTTAKNHNSSSEKKLRRHVENNCEVMPPRSAVEDYDLHWTSHPGDDLDICGPGEEDEWLSRIQQVKKRNTAKRKRKAETPPPPSKGDLDGHHLQRRSLTMKGQVASHGGLEVAPILRNLARNYHLYH